ncbi:MAG: POTRA domain-containing protein [Candidatus Acidiferrales bacterium]
MSVDWSFSRRLAVFFAVLCMGLPGRTAAQTAPPAAPQRVVAVRIVGETGAVLEENPSRLTLQPGQPFSLDAERQTLRELFRSGRYADLRAVLTPVAGGVRIDYVVRANLFINQVLVTGLHEPPSEGLAESSLQLGLGEPFRQTDIDPAIARLRQTLANDGLYQAKLDPVLAPRLDQNAMNITVQVAPGPRAKFGTITIQASPGMNSEDLRGHLRLKSGKEVTSDALQHASDRLRNWLVARGYLSARVTLTRGDYIAASNTMPLTVTVTTGLKVNVQVVGFKISNHDLRQLLPIYQEGAVDDDLLQEGRRDLRNALERQGYFDVAVTYTVGQPAGLPPAISQAQPSSTPEGQATAVDEGQAAAANPAPPAANIPVPSATSSEGPATASDQTTVAAGNPAPVPANTRRSNIGKTEDIVYTVVRGSRRRLVGVAFDGNQYFSTVLLRSRLNIEPAGFASHGKFSQDLLDQDSNSILGLYQANGFLSAQVKSETTENYHGKSGDIFVQFHVQEGEQTRVGELHVAGNRIISAAELQKLIGSSAGQPYSDFNVATDRDNILALYYDQGFPNAQFSSQIENMPPAQSGGNPRVRLTYTIVEGAQLQVSGVMVAGFERTRLGVIEREVTVKAGQPLSEGQVFETQRRLYNLGIFTSVQVAPQNPDGEDPDKNMVVLVEEAKSLTLAYGIGIEAQRVGTASSGPTGTVLDFSPRVTFEITKANLTGRADTLSFKIRASTLQGRGVLDYTHPNFLGKKRFSLDITGYADKTRDIQTFTSTRYEGSIQLTDKLTPYTSLIGRYFYRHILASDLQIEPEEIPLFSQPTRASGFGLTYVRDRRNNAADPTHGEFDNADISEASKSLGSSSNFIRFFLQDSTYTPLGRRLVFARSTSFGVQSPYSGSLSTDIPLPERFFAGGGGSLRGFGLNQAGPRDPLTGFPIGGLALLEFNQDLRFPMHLPWIGDRLGGGLFYDGGNVFSDFKAITLRDKPLTPVFSSTIPGTCIQNCTNQLDYFSHTVGFEFRYATPVGPISIDLGYQLNAPQFLLPATSGGGLTLQRLPAFQFFVNLGGSY